MDQARQKSERLLIHTIPDSDESSDKCNLKSTDSAQSVSPASSSVNQWKQEVWN